jgi:isochorismate synthase
MERSDRVTHASTREFLANAINVYVHNSFSFALWRLPDSDSFFLAGSDRPQQIDEVVLEETAPGFVFSPFDPHHKKIFLPADDLFKSDNAGNLSIQGSKLEGMIADKTGAPKKIKYGFTNESPSFSLDDKERFKELVSKSTELVSNGTVEKIVPSRSKKVALPEDFDLIDSFQRLCDLYPQAMVSVFSSPLSGTWMGATPELLVCVDSRQHFRTVAVAGTQPCTDSVDVKKVTWTQKDIEEQALVERYIISCFKKIRVREFEEHGPKTVIAGNLFHLRTDFDVDMAAINFPQLGTVMLKLLHPTSAVCGMPLEPSLDFLKQNEGYDRQFYSGFLGPVNILAESHLYVNLRCMQLFPGGAILYAGAGVLADSDPEKEWSETEMKMNTLGRIIRQ